ncbi:MAG: L-sorbosone dehydrogenase [Candidatus Eremiobacteraeota bacterium]|nr:L-sorbosone dehydrogenase [Candidatus Eremiobacteraeota bacterium]
MPISRLLLFGLSLAAVTLVAPHAVRAQTSANLALPAGFAAERIATVRGARELSVAPNGDLFVGTYGNTVYVVPDAEATAGAARVFATFDDRPVAGVFVTGDAVYAGAQFGVYRIPYRSGEREARTKPEKVAAVRPGGGGGHSTTTVAFSRGVLYASVGSSCNACEERDPTRATVQAMTPDGKNMHARAVDIRNAIALAVNPADGGVWAGVAGRDDLEHGHPYEIFDEVTAHAGTPDYGWLHCSDDRKPIDGGSCANVVVPRVVFPAYDTPIGAAFYPADAKGKFAFPAAYRGGAFVALHGSWHQPPVPPRVAFVAFKGTSPAKGVDWNNPAVQWSEFLGGCQSAAGSRICRPTGVAVGSDGSLFISEDDTGAIYRIRPTR